MHIPDGFLGGEALAIGAVAAAVGVGVCLRQVRGDQRERDLPVAGLAAAFFLVGDAPMFPISVGTEGHLLGGTLAVALLGPWLGALTITVVCAIQALALGDGGVASMGLNVVNLALVPAFVGYPLLLLLRRLLPTTANGLSLACAGAAAVSVILSSCLFVGEFALGAVVDIDLRTLAYSTIGAYCIDPMGNGGPLPPEVLERLVPGLKNHPTTLIFLAYKNQHAVGLATCFRGFSTFAARPLINIHDLVVLPDHRGMGIGHRILAAVEQKARELGCCKVTLEVQENNAKARRTYQQAGFSQGLYSPTTGGSLFYWKTL